MSKQVMKRALDALEGADAIDTDMAAAIAELRAEIAKPVEPVAWARLRADGRAPDVVWQETAPDESYELALYCEPPDNEAMRRDAERYRWLRSTTNWVSSKGRRIDVRNCPEVWDESIDAAIAQGVWND